MENTMKFAVTLLLLTQASAQVVKEFSNGTSDLEIYDKSEILSRRKRFIIFPEGSSVQLVFCLTFPTIFAIGDIFLYGYTAALAFELPQDPYSPFDHHADPLHRRMDQKTKKTLYFMNEDGKIIFKKPYKRKFIVNPAFAKRSVDGTRPAETGGFKKGTPEQFKIDRKQMHASKHKREFLKSEHLDKRSVEFHRSSRASLYGKIETMMQGLGADGRQCMLKTLCLVGQSQSHPQGSFLQEILRAVFTLPKGHFEDPEEKEYDTAQWTSESCDTLYPKCNDPISPANSPIFSH